MSWDEQSLSTRNPVSHHAIFYLFGRRFAHIEPMSKRLWKQVPTSLRAGFELDKQRAIHEQRLSVEAMAELAAVSNSRLYKWMEDGDLPVARLAWWFHTTGGKAVIRYLCAQAGGTFLETPSGRRVGALDMAELQQVQASTIAALWRFYAGEAEQDTTIAQVQQALEGLAYHRENVRKAHQPELPL